MECKDGICEGYPQSSFVSHQLMKILMGSVLRIGTAFSFKF